MKSSSSLAQQFVKQINSLERTRKEIDSLYSKDLVKLSVVEHTYAALYLSVFTSFEGFLEDLFIGLLVDGKGYAQTNVNARVLVKTHAIARELIFAEGNGNYVNWLPFNYTERRSRLFFTAGRPFTSLDDRYKGILQQSQDVRNVLAHRSSDSLERFTKRVVGNQKLNPREKKPLGYLRAFHTSATPTKYEFHVNSLSLVASSITSWRK